MAMNATGCGKKKDQTVSTDGSTSMEKVIGYLSEAYMEENSDTKVTYNPTGSGAGIKAVQEGRCDIGLSSRNLKDDETSELNAEVVAIDGIAVIVNNSNPVEDLDVAEIAKIYTGELQTGMSLVVLILLLSASDEKRLQEQETVLNPLLVLPITANMHKS